MENSIELEEENQGKLFTISEIGKMLGKTRSMIVGLIDELKLVSKCDKTKKYNGDDINKIKELIEFKKCFRSLYSTDEIHKICGIAFASVTNIINDLQLKGVTYNKGYEDYKNNKNLYDELKYNDKAELSKRMLYGDNYATKFADKANETKRRLYGDDFGKKFWDKADETCRELYGDDYREKLTKKSWRFAQHSN